jgi:hypothetical protein
MKSKTKDWKKEYDKLAKEYEDYRIYSGGKRELVNKLHKLVGLDEVIKSKKGELYFNKKRCFWMV